MLYENVEGNKDNTEGEEFHLIKKKQNGKFSFNQIAILGYSEYRSYDKNLILTTKSSCEFQFIKVNVYKDQ